MWSPAQQPRPAGRGVGGGVGGGRGPEQRRFGALADLVRAHAQPPPPAGSTASGRRTTGPAGWRAADSADLPSPGARTLWSALEQVVTAAGMQWLRRARARVRELPEAIERLFPVAGRACGRGPLEATDPLLANWTVSEAARTLLLLALTDPPDRLAGRCAALYVFGDAAERRAVLRALGSLPLGAHALPLVRDALRTNDPRLVEAALGPYGATHLDQRAWCQGVLSCLPLGVDPSRLAGLEQRADAKLRRMLVAFALERAAAGHDVPGALWRVVDRCPG
jgi:hypothetical protein